MKVIVMCVIVFTAIAASLQGKIFINKSPSLPVGLWEKTSDPIDKGAFIIFCPTPSQVFPGYGPGGCNNGLSPMIKKVQSIANGKLFVVGSHPRSYDSHNFGPISKDQVLTTVRPFLVWR